MEKRALGRSGLTTSPIVFGGNVFGWTIDEKTSFDVLDAFVDHGFDTIDTADVYSRWVDGNSGGESEAILGNWFAARPGMRQKVTLFTKVGSDMGGGKRDLSEAYILQAVEASLKRLKTDVIDLYFSHWPVPEAGHDETLGAYDKLIRAGKVRAVGASNYDAAMLAAAAKVSQSAGLPQYSVLQPEYNLLDRASYDGELRDYCIENDLGVVTYFSLASGFLSGKYRAKEDFAKYQRGGRVEKYFDARGKAVLAALDEVAGRTGASPAEISLAWLIARKGVTAPIASATKLNQVESFAKAAELTLSAEDLAALDKASAPA